MLSQEQVITPRIAPEAFTKSQALKLLKAKVRLRGIRDLEARAVRLYENIIKNNMDGLNPVERRQLIQLRDDIAKAYQWKNTSYRVAGGAAVGAASAAVVSLIVQIAYNQEVDLTSICETAITGGLYGAGGTLADASVYHMATNYGIAPETAKSLAQQSVAAGFCLISTATDIISEAKLYRRGDINIESAVSGGSLKTALNLFPILLVPMGLVGIPILVMSQLGGRIGIAKIREAEQLLEKEIACEYHKSDLIIEKLDWFHALYKKAKKDCDDTDKIYEDIMF